MTEGIASEIGVAVLGLGNVGSEVVRIIAESVFQVCHGPVSRSRDLLYIQLATSLTLSMIPTSSSRIFIASQRLG